MTTSNHHSLAIVDRKVICGISADVAAGLAERGGYVLLRPKQWLAGGRDRSLAMAFSRSIGRLDDLGLIETKAANLKRERATHARLTERGVEAVAEYADGAIG